MTTRKARLIIVLLFSVFFTVPSCELQKDDPFYVGTWLLQEQAGAENIVYNTTRTLVLTKNTFEETFVIQRENSSTISGIIGTKGTLLHTHYNLVFFLKELGTCEEDGSGICTGTVVWYDEGSEYWTENIKYYEVSVKADLKTDDLSLSLKRDLNNDGDINDTGEDLIFEKI